MITPEQQEELQRIIRLRPLLNKCAAYRTSLSIYRQILKSTYSNECEKLINVEIAIDKENLKIPPKENIPPLRNEVISDNNMIDNLIMDVAAVQNALNSLN